MLKRLLCISLFLALAGPVPAAWAATETLAIAAAVRAPDGKPLEAFTLKFIQGDQVVGECVTDAEGVCGFILTYNVAGADVEVLAESYTWADMPNSVGGGSFAPGPRLPLSGEGVTVDERATGAAAKAGAQWLVRLAVIADQPARKLSLNPDPFALPDPPLVFTVLGAPTAAPTETKAPTATTVSATATAAPTALTATALPPTPLSGAQAAVAPTATPTPAPATPDWPANGWLLALGAAVIAGALVMARRGRKAQ